MADDKYKMFRNFMVNELGITRDDIKEWTIEAVQDQARKIAGQINVSGLAKDQIEKEINRQYNSMADRVARQLAERINLNITIDKK